MTTSEKTYSSEKNKQIAETFLATKQRRKNQTILLVDLKVKYGKKFGMSQAQMDFFDNVFIEAKRLKNYVLSLSENTDYEYDFEEVITEEHAAYLKSVNQYEDVVQVSNLDDASNSNEFDVFKADQKDFKTVWYYTKGLNKPDTEYKEYELQYLGSYAKANVLSTICSNIKTLATLKKEGKKVGALKYVSEYNSITYKKEGFGFGINIGNSTAKIQGCKGWFKVWGIEQFSEIRKMDPDYEIATATLIRNVNGDYHLHMIVYVDKQKLINFRKSKIAKKKYVKPGEEIIGIDFGCETNYTLSNGEKINHRIEESEHHKRLQKKVQHCEKGSNNHFKARQKLQKSYDKMNNKKDQLAREFVHDLKLKHDTIVIQDENLSGWIKSNHGNKIWHSTMGRVKELLMNDRELKVIVLDRFIPTTKFCFECGQMHKMIQLNDREYICPHCGSRMDRDVHAAKNMVWIYKMCLKHNIIPPDGRVITRADFDRLVSMVFGNRKVSDRVEGMPADCCETDSVCGRNNLDANSS